MYVDNLFIHTMDFFFLLGGERKVNQLIIFKQSYSLFSFLVQKSRRNKINSTLFFAPTADSK